LLIGDMRAAMAHFGKHPVHAPLTSAEASCFHH
jgi:hypothetical protein